MGSLEAMTKGSEKRYVWEDCKAPACGPAAAAASIKVLAQGVSGAVALHWIHLFAMSITFPILSCCIIRTSIFTTFPK